MKKLIELSFQHISSSKAMLQDKGFRQLKIQCNFYNGDY